MMFNILPGTHTKDTCILNSSIENLDNPFAVFQSQGQLTGYQIQSKEKVKDPPTTQGGKCNTKVIMSSMLQAEHGRARAAKIR